MVAGNSSEPGFLVPSAMGFNNWQMWLCCMLYLVIGATAFLTVLITTLRKQGTYYRSSFLAVSGIFCTVRGMMTLISYNDWDDHIFWLYLLEDFVPVYLQFWNFSLLLLFVIKTLYILHDQEEFIHRWTFYPLFHFCQFMLLVLCVIISYVQSLQFREDDADEWDRSNTIVTMCLYAFLSIFGSIYYYRLYRMITATAASLSSQAQFTKYFVLIPVYLSIFFARAVWNLLYFAGANPLQSKISSWMRDNNTNAYASAFLIFYAIYEIIPTALVVYFFASRVLFNCQDFQPQTPTEVSTPSLSAPLRPKPIEAADLDSRYGYRPFSDGGELNYTAPPSVTASQVILDQSATSTDFYPTKFRSLDPDIRASSLHDSDSDSDSGLSPLHVHNSRHDQGK